MSNFSTRLKELRDAKNLKQKDVADGSDITVRAYQYYESGKQEPSMVKLKNLAVFFNVSIDYLVGLTDSLKISDTHTQYSDKATVNLNVQRCNTENDIASQYSDAALDIAKIFDKVPSDAQRRIKRHVMGEYDDLSH